MKTCFLTKKTRALTRIEVLTIVAVLVVLAALFLPVLAKSKARSSRIGCVNCLRQIGLAFRVWAGDNNDHYPMQVSTNNGGTMEWIGGPNAFRHFEVMSNELSTPKILFCPNETDSSRTMANVFGAATSPEPRWQQIPFTNNSNLSYFVGVDASDTNVNMFLSGDRNITNGTPIRDGLLELTANQPVGWTREIHVKRGNVAMADGSVQTLLSTAALREALMKTGIATNRLAMP